MKEGWEIKTLDEACEVEYGTRVVQKRDGGSIYPVYGGGGATFFLDTFNREDCLVVARFAMSAQCTRFIKGKFFLNDSGLTVRPKNDNELLIDFLNLHIFYLNDNIYSLSRGTAQKNLDVAAFRNIQISYPKNIQEQQRIVSILNECFAAIDKAKANAEQNLKNAKELFESYLQGVFENKGDGWEEKPLREVCSDFLQGINTATDKTVFVDEGIPILQAKEIGLNKLDLCNTKFITRDKFEEAAERYKPKKGDILYNNIGSSMGRSIIVDWDFDFTIAWNVMRIIPNRKITIPKFLNYILQSPLVYYDIIFKAKGVGMPFISKKDLIEIMVSYPSLSKQKTIVKKLDALSDETKKLEAIYQQKINDLEDLKKSVLQKAFSGELKTSTELV
jgi:type I restriction enzyme S subunit